MSLPSSSGLAAEIRSKTGQFVLVLQGGGALGAYQAGIYEALHEAGIEPDWTVGTSIGAINASLIAGNPPEDRVARLKQFWAKVEQNSLFDRLPLPSAIQKALANASVVNSGVAGFFAPNPVAFLGPDVLLGAEAAGYYSTRPLETTLGSLVDFDYLARGPVRLTVGAANVRTSQMRYFDSREMPLSVKHVLASGALPPAFPAIRIGDALYWDGGILSNTPVEVVFDDMPRRNSLVVAVHLWNPDGADPKTIGAVNHRLKDLQYASRTSTHISRQRQIHRLRHIVAELAARLPHEAREDKAIREMAAYGCLTNMHVVRLLAPDLDHADESKDIDFSREGIAARWRAGLEDARRMIAQAPWEKPVDPLAGFHLHEMNPERGIL